MSAAGKHSETILIKDVVVNGKSCDIFIKDGRFHRIAANLREEADITLSGQGKMILPSFANAHTSAALSLLKGFISGISLTTLQQQYLIPFYGCLNEDDVYWGTKLACLEMIKSGTTFLVDNSPHWWGAAKAVHEMGMRGVLSIPFEQHDNQDVICQMKKRVGEIHYSSRSYSERIGIALAPTAIEELSPHLLHWLGDYANEHQLHIHTPLSCSQQRVQRCLTTYGKRPLHRLDDAGMVNNRLGGIHALWLDEAELELMAERGGRIVLCPSAAMKQALRQLDYQKIKEKEIPLLLGTDSSAVSGHQNMLQEVRMLSLLAKNQQEDPTVFSAETSLRLANRAATLFGIDNGEIAVGKLADCILLNLSHPSLVPNHNDIDNLVYGADSGAIETTICNGTILMHNRQVPGEEEILDKSRETVARILSRWDNIC